MSTSPTLFIYFKSPILINIFISYLTSAIFNLTPPFHSLFTFKCIPSPILLSPYYSAYSHLVCHSPSPGGQRKDRQAAYQTQSLPYPLCYIIPDPNSLTFFSNTRHLAILTFSILILVSNSPNTYHNSIRFLINPNSPRFTNYHWFQLNPLIYIYISGAISPHPSPIQDHNSTT